MQTKRGVWLSAALLAICACHDTAVDGKEPDAPADAGVATRAAASNTAGDAAPAGRDAGQSQATQTSHAAAASGSAAPDTRAAVDAGIADAAANAPVEVASPKEAAYCNGATKLLELPADPGAPGPWAVGSRAVKIGNMEAEVWYPAKPGTNAGQTKFVYDLRKYLPPEQQGTVTESTTILQPCDCYRDLELDTEHGPYAVVVFAHGFSGFAGQSLPQMTHWASRGFIVLSADHPSLGLKTFLTDGIVGIAAGGASGGGCDSTMATGQRAEVIQELDALQKPSGDLAFLESHIDARRVTASGHSAGGMAIQSLSNYAGVHVLMPMASGGVCDGSELQSSLTLGGMTDGIAAYTGQQDGYANAKPKKRLVGLAKAGHMAFTGFCPIGASSGGILAAAQKAGVMFDPLFLSIVEPLSSDGCQQGSLPAQDGWDAINYATAAALEETLLCIPDRSAQLAMLTARFPAAVGEYKEELK